MSLRNPLISSFKLPIVFLILLWVLKLSEIGLNQNWSSWGIYPRHFIGLRGIFFSPLLHGSIQHLLSNTLPLLVLLTSIFYFYKKVAWKIFISSYLFVGVWVWILGRESYHIGASGLVYSFFAFLVFSGILRKQRKLLAISLITLFLYGSTIWGIFPQALHVSWESHLLGFFTGVLLAYYFKDEESSLEQTKINDDPEYSRDFWNDVIEK